MNEGLKICCTITWISCNYYTYIPSLLGDFPGAPDSKESACNAGDPGLIPGLGRSPGGGHGYSVQYSSLENHHGQRSLAGYSPRGHTESATAERSPFSFSSLLSLPPWPHPTLLGQHRLPGWDPCVTWQLLTSYPFYTNTTLQSNFPPIKEKKKKKFTYGKTV